MSRNATTDSSPEIAKAPNSVFLRHWMQRLSNVGVAHERPPMTTNLTGLRVKLDRPTCCQNICVIGSGKGPHGARLDCADCGSFCGWVDKGTMCWIESVVLFFGTPIAPTEVHKAQ